MIKKLALAMAVAATPVFAETVTVETYRGPVDVAKNPETVLALDISAVDTLNALGVTIDGSINKMFVSYLDEVKNSATVVGTIHEPDFEVVASMSPDLIIAAGRSSKVAPDLAKLAPTIDMTVDGDMVATSLAHLAAYGEIFGKEDEAAELKAEFEAKLDAAKEAIDGKGKALVIMTNGPKVSAYGKDSRFGWLHANLGLPEAVENVAEATHGEAISFEFIRNANPDILIVIDRLAAIGRDGANAQTTLDNALVHETNAWKNGNVVYLDSAPVYIAGTGIQSLMLSLDKFLAAFPAS
ncbi:MAG: siderophore ABC transporter substrate-binding protein [Cognatishimia sp.]|nr:siderophore ABC transporter substrate-binding protein [Cognatishimia sp.]